MPKASLLKLISTRNGFQKLFLSAVDSSVGVDGGLGDGLGRGPHGWGKLG